MTVHSQTLSSHLTKLAEWQIKIIWWLRYIVEFGFKSHERVIRSELGRIDGKVLDLGCGIGNFSTLFPEAEYNGVDVDEDLIAYAKKNFSSQFFVADGAQTDFSAGYFDAALTIGVLHHLEDDGVRAVSKELSRVVKRGGKILIIEDERPTFRQNPLLNLFFAVDRGGKFRTFQEYRQAFGPYFTINDFYSLKSGLWRYNVFVIQNGAVE